MLADAYHFYVPPTVYFILMAIYQKNVTNLDVSDTTPPQRKSMSTQYRVISVIHLFGNTTPDTVMHLLDGIGVVSGSRLVKDDTRCKQQRHRNPPP